MDARIAQMMRCPHDNVVSHPAPDLIPTVIRPHRLVKLRPRTRIMAVLRCVDCDIRWEAT